MSKKPIVEKATKKFRHTGRIVAIKGPVVDVHYPLELPDIYNAIIVVTSNQGLSGSYNSDIIKKVETIIPKHKLLIKKALDEIKANKQRS